MFNNRIIPVEVTAQSRILVSCVTIDGEESKVLSRFGVTYDCVFNNHDISIGILNPFKLKELELSKVIIPYQKIEFFKFSIVRLPMSNPLIRGPQFALDILIQTKENSYHLETQAYKLIEKIIQKAKVENIHILDPMGLIELCGGCCAEIVKEKLTPLYDNFMSKYDLQNYRNVDDRSRVKI
jgi:hypothetical protein